MLLLLYANCMSLSQLFEVIVLLVKIHLLKSAGNAIISSGLVGFVFLLSVGFLGLMWFCSIKRAFSKEILQTAGGRIF